MSLWVCACPSAQFCQCGHNSQWNKENFPPSTYTLPLSYSHHDHTAAYDRTLTGVDHQPYLSQPYYPQAFQQHHDTASAPPFPVQPSYNSSSAPLSFPVLPSPVTEAVHALGAAAAPVAKRKRTTALSGNTAPKKKSVGRPSIIGSNNSAASSEIITADWVLMNATQSLDDVHCR
jgi:hypothetical protein